jgi:hypothetical protein
VVEEIIIASSNDAALEAKTVFGQVQAMATHTASYKIRGVRAPNSTKLIAHKKQRPFPSTMTTPERLSRPFTAAIFAF